MTRLRQMIEALDELAAMARWQAATLRERWWRAYGDDADEWRAKIARAEERAFNYELDSARLRAIVAASE